MVTSFITDFNHPHPLKSSEKTLSRR